RRAAWAFLAAWVLSLAVVATIVLLIADGVDAADGGAAADWTSVVRLALAALLVGVAVREWRRRPADGEDAELPGWMRRLDAIRPGRAAALAAGLAAVKPKNPLLTAAAAVAVAQAGVPPAEQAVAVAAFVVLGTIGPALPAAIDLLMRERGPALLDGLRAWMVRENGTIIAVLCLALAAKLAGDALSALG
ncbi:MAG: GAP family protein, partial [Solirubrobacteraceae bacterium]|nr:GAP family protein [Solirubrobacteraceae bacterium]